MSEKYFRMFQYGMMAQVQELTLDELVVYIENHLHSFLLDHAACVCFIERLSCDPGLGESPDAQKQIMYIMDKALQLRPFRPVLLSGIHQLTRNPQIKARLDMIQATNELAEAYELIEKLPAHESDDAIQFLEDMLQQHPNHLPAAQHLLHLCHATGKEPGPQLTSFKPPLPLKSEWDNVLFNHYAANGRTKESLAYWNKLRESRIREVSLNLAAEMFASLGDVEKAKALYERSLAMDPLQGPIHYRLNELNHPMTAVHSLLTERRVNICLYSWNKDRMLGQTLESLSRTDIGNARIDILLNGCTDNSAQVVQDAIKLFPNNQVTVHGLHVNIGAPAARNWLLGLPSVQDSDYVAFLDDDVTLQQDWLVQFLTVAEQDKRIGVVGCKVVHPGTPGMYQYLYRHVAIANHDALVMSNDTPFQQYDIGTYDFVRETRNVMGCCHLLRTSALCDVPAGFDIRFSPSQIDDIDHDLMLCLAGHKVMYCGTVTCVHHQSSGTNYRTRSFQPASTGNALGNDIKLFYKHVERIGDLAKLDSISVESTGKHPVM